MGNSLMMRGAAGQLAGYIQKMGSVVRCKLTAGGGEAEVTLLLDGGGSERRQAPLDGTETSWPAPPGKIAAAYAIAGNRVIGASDARAREAGLRRLDERNAARTSTTRGEAGASGEAPTQASADDQGVGGESEAPTQASADEQEARAASEAPTQATADEQEAGAASESPTQVSAVDQGAGASGEAPTNTSADDQGAGAASDAPTQASADDQEAGAASEAPTKASADEEKAGPAEGTDASTAVLPERRWPPPPCCPQARYVRGSWITGDEGPEAPAHGAT